MKDTNIISKNEIYCSVYISNVYLVDNHSSILRNKVTIKAFLYDNKVTFISKSDRY